jgi:hypothetical protein
MRANGERKRKAQRNPTSQLIEKGHLTKMTKSLLLIGTLALASLASAKSYANMVISSPALVGGQKLAAGEYIVQVRGDKAVFTNVDTDRTVTASVKVENSSETFDRTAAACKTTEGAIEIQSIELGGSNTKLEIGE